MAASQLTAVAQLGGNPEASAPLVAHLEALGKQLRAINRARALLARQDSSCQAQAHLADRQAMCARVIDKMAGERRFAERRKRVDQVRVKVQPFRPGRRPRWVATSEVIPEAAADANSYYTL